MKHEKFLFNKEACSQDKRDLILKVKGFSIFIQDSFNQKKSFLSLLEQERIDINPFYYKVNIFILKSLDLIYYLYIYTTNINYRNLFFFRTQMDSKLKTLFLATGLSLTPVSSIAQQSIQD